MNSLPANFSTWQSFCGQSLLIRVTSALAKPVRLKGPKSIACAAPARPSAAAATLHGARARTRARGPSSRSGSCCVWRVVHEGRASAVEGRAILKALSQHSELCGDVNVDASVFSRARDAWIIRENHDRYESAFKNNRVVIARRPQEDAACMNMGSRFALGLALGLLLALRGARRSRSRPAPAPTSSGPRAATRACRPRRCAPRPCSSRRRRRASGTRR